MKEILPASEAKKLTEHAKKHDISAFEHCVYKSIVAKYHTVNRCRG